MGDVVRLVQRHARTSESANLRAAKAARVSSVTSEQPRSAARRATPAQCGAGMPLVFQPLTVDMDCDSASATAPVSPSASMIASQDFAMGANIVRTVRTCQPSSICEATIRGGDGQIVPMDTDKDVARRLIAVREHFKLNQAAFADRLHIAKNTLNGFEKAKRSLTLETAKRIRQRFGVSIDWLLFGDVGQPSHGLVLELGPAPPMKKDEQAPRTGRKSKKAA